MFSAGMLAAFASAMIVRSRGFMSGSPPPARAATVNSLMIRVKIRPRLASSAPFLCLIDAHFEWPDMAKLPEESCDCTPGGLRALRQDEPDVGPRIPRAALVIPQHRCDLEAGALELRGHLRNRYRAEHQRKITGHPHAAAGFDELLVEN